MRYDFLCDMKYSLFSDDSSRRERVRAARFAGTSYPSHPTKLSDLLDGVMGSASNTVQAASRLVPNLQHLSASELQQARAIVAPHIDFRVGLSCYAPAYYAIQQAAPELVVVIATSHYGWQDIFIPTRQHFATPFGVVRTDSELVDELYARLPYRLTEDDSAHHEEHSIEFEAVWLQYLFGGREFTMLPILVTSFHPYIQRGMLPLRTKKFAQFVETLQAIINSSGKRVVWVASGDMAHVGRKFDDEYDAEPLLDELRCEDEELMRAMEDCDAARYFHSIASVGDARKICGLPPVYTMLEAMKSGGEQWCGAALDYQQWNERATRSAVTYSSLAYWQV